MVCHGVVRPYVALPCLSVCAKEDMVVCIADDGSPHALYFTPPTNLFGLGKVGHMIPFFVGGILCCKYEWQKYIAGYWALGISAVMFLMWNILAVMPDPMNFFSISIGIIFFFFAVSESCKDFSNAFLFI